MKYLITTITASLLLVGCDGEEPTPSSVSKKPSVQATSHTTNTKKRGIAKNIIMVVADGMGYAYPVAYRYWQDDVTTAHVEPTIFDRTLVGSSSTYPLADKKAGITANNNRVYVTDSAASATSLATGIKTYNGAIGVDINGQPLTTVLEVAKSVGKATGVVATSQIVHATPASYIAKNESRRNYDAIADDFFDLQIDGQPKADVMLGGGSDYFIREDRNLVTEFKQHGYRYLDDLQQLTEIESGQKVLGLFAPVALPANLNSEMANPLLQMSKAAISALENDNGYFLVIEASQVDWGGHANDLAYAMGEMDDLAKTMEYLYTYSQEHDNTLVVMTADHETGGMSIAANGRYQFNPHYLDKINASPKSIAASLATKKLDIKQVQSKLGFSLTNDELNHFTTLLLENQQQALNKTWTEKAKQRDLTDRYYGFIKALIDQRTNTGWTTTGHTAADVPVFAFGVGAVDFTGHHNNIDIAQKLFKKLEK